jgi:hypothetical protein
MLEEAQANEMMLICQGRQAELHGHIQIVFVGCVGCAYGHRKDGVGASESPSWLGDVQANPRWHLGKQQPESDNLSNSSLVAV